MAKAAQETTDEDVMPAGWLETTNRKPAHCAAYPVASESNGRKTAMPETDRQSPLGITVNEAILRDDWAVWAGSGDIRL
jgi:hypothetical protein